MTLVEWCGHQQEALPAPEADGWFFKIPVVGVAS
jgi:hypothetical protein